MVVVVVEVLFEEGLLVLEHVEAAGHVMVPLVLLVALLLKVWVWVGHLVVVVVVGSWVAFERYFAPAFVWRFLRESVESFA